MRLVNQRTGVTLAREVEVAATRASRRKGLLGRPSLDSASALVIERCFAIHTAFMRFAIDAVFLDRNGIVRRVVVSLPPWRAAVTIGADAVVELAAGAAVDVQVGDRIYRSDESD